MALISCISLGTALELALQWFGVIPEEHSDFFGGGWHQVFYVFGLLAFNLALLLLNLLLWLAHRKKETAA